jgi:hypothetical protein
MKTLTYSKLVKEEFKNWHNDFPFPTTDKISYTEGFSDGVWNTMIALKESGLLTVEEIFTIIQTLDPKGESLAFVTVLDWMED